GHARHEVFAEGGVRAQEVAVAAGLGCRYDLRGGGGRQAVFVCRVVRLFDGVHARDLCRLFGDGVAVTGQNQYVDFAAQCAGAGDSTGGGFVEFAVQVVGDDEGSGAHASPLSLSLAISSSTLVTRSPAARWGGAVVFVTLR